MHWRTFTLRAKSLLKRLLSLLFVPALCLRVLYVDVVLAEDIL